MANEYKRHEVLHMTSFLINAVATELLEHDAVIEIPEWRELAEKAHQALFDLYQAIGKVHLSGDKEVDDA